MAWSRGIVPPWLRGALALPDFRVSQLELKQPFEGEYSLVELAEMYVLLLGVTKSLPFLPIG